MVMRRELIKALDFPISLLLETIEQRDCPHDSLFETTSAQCQQCDLNRECHWLSCLNEFSDFESKATYTINASVRYGIDVVGTLCGDLNHDDTICGCGACTWLREARRLTSAFDARFASNRYRRLF